ncbi:hypothetical protein ACFQ7F_34285 [Streptomyces sp. NPDC056486]
MLTPGPGDPVENLFMVGHARSLTPDEVRKLVEYALHGLLAPAPTTAAKP